MTVTGNRTETQIAIESVASNGVKHVTDALLREAQTDQAIERILTTHTQMFASRRDTIPASTDVRTIIVRHVVGVPEKNCRWNEVRISIVDKNGVHRSPAARSKTFL